MANNSAVKPATANYSIQLSFDLDSQVIDLIRKRATENGVSIQDQIRDLLELPINKPKRPRVGISVSQEEYLFLAEKLKISPSNSKLLKKHIQIEINNIK